MGKQGGAGAAINLVTLFYVVIWKTKFLLLFKFVGLDHRRPHACSVVSLWQQLT